VRYIGFSNWRVWKAAVAWQMQKERGWATFSNGQMYYSMLGRDVEYDIVPFMQHAGIGMTVWSPLAGGFLSGKYTRESLKDQDNRLSGFDILPFDKEMGFKVVDTMQEIAKEHHASVAQIAFAWLLSKPVVSSILVGASKIHQLEDNLKAVEVELSETAIRTLDALTQPPVLYPHWFVQNLVDQQQKEILG
jgi:aryl-alcohol dehydrogenase-like predicted oxidoreductase